MNLKDKNVLVLGLGVSGISTIKALHKLDANIIVTDLKSENELKNSLEEIKDIPMVKRFNSDDIDLEGIDLIVKSPGIPPRVKIVEKAIDENIEIITDIELAYRISPTRNLITVTGTNGKTTSTILIGQIFKDASYRTNVVGNVGVGILEKIIDAKEDDVFVIEASSFQLEHTNSFKPKISLITNLTPDHGDWHGSFENYINSKLKVFRNQDNEDYLILNYDDPILKNMDTENDVNIIYFSTKVPLKSGVYVEGNDIIVDYKNNKTKLMKTTDLKILGRHNLENALGCIAVTMVFGIELGIIKNTLISFPGVEHRLEFVTDRGGIKFYNDSKGTNPDASIKAIEALNAPIILIAGGYDKKSDYTDFIIEFKKKGKYLILLGDTREKIKNTAIANGIENIEMVDSLAEAVKFAYSIGSKNDNVLLSPACASWDMYTNFEERGRDFKNEVFNLME